MAAFRAKEFLPLRVIERITDLRVREPERSLEAARARRRRKQLTLDGRLNILAADHPARRVLRVGDDKTAMADRHDYLARIVRVMECESVDGVMATMDIIEDLLLVDEIRSEEGKARLLAEKLLIASLNRGGLLGTAWEMDDPMTGAMPGSVLEWNLDGAKILLRICDDDPGSLRTMEATAKAISELNALGIPNFLEPLPVERREGGYKVIKTAEALAEIAGVASALGSSSRLMWLKLPYCENYEMVARSTTLPILLLGGESTGDPRGFLRELERGMAAGSNVRGALAGRNVLYPGDGDPAEAAAAIGRIVHDSAEC